MECVHRWCVLWCVWEALPSADEKWGFEQGEIKITITITIIATKDL